MSRRIAFVPYRPKTILNKHNRPDNGGGSAYVKMSAVRYGRFTLGIAAGSP